jgi:uncharacterized protein YacL
MKDTQHSQHQSAEMMRSHYVMFGLNLGISLVIMYFVMFTMIYSVGEFFNNLNMFYMALMMAAPMGILMLLLMGSMYSNRKLNLLLHAGLALIFILAFIGMRAQAVVGDRQFLRSMIPHHSGAILMCERAALRGAEIKSLCGNIIEGQKQEIDQMKELLARS